MAKDAFGRDLPSAEAWDTLPEDERRRLNRDLVITNPAQVPEDYIAPKRAQFAAWLAANDGTSKAS